MSPHLDTQARIAMMQAHDTARELGHSEVGPDHVLLGLLADVRGDAYAVLTRHGLTYATAREVVARDHAEGTPPEPAVGDSDGDLERDRAALLAIGIDLARLRDSVRERFGEDLTEGWGERRARGPRGPRGGGRGPRREGRGRGRGPGAPENGDDAEPGPGGPGRGRRGPRSRRFGGEGLSPAMREALVGLVHESREERTRLGADRLLLAVLRSDDPVVAAVVATVGDPAALRADAELATA